MTTKIRTAAATAAVLMAAAACAQAQSTVTLSGFLDIGAYRGYDKNKAIGPIKRNNIALSGAEDLGNGMKAIFKLSHRLEPDTGAVEGYGAKPFWHGEATVGLQGAFGKLRLGRALDVISNNDWAFDPWENFDRIASPAWNIWHTNYASDRTSNNGGGEYGRLNNGIFYDSPSLAGLSLHFSGAFENSDTSAGAGTGNNAGLGVRYVNGGMQLFAAHSKNSSSDTVTFVGARYKWGDLTLMGAYDRSKLEKGPAADSLAKAYSIGATYAIGPTTLKVGYGHRKLTGTDSINFYGLGADYALSKRTSVYVSVGNKPVSGERRTAAGVGVSHAF